MHLIIKAMEAYAPPELAEEWDNVGFLLGDDKKEAHRVLVALDITDQVVEEAISCKVDLIVSHHPLIFKPLDRIVATNGTGGRIIQLIRHNIAVYAAHTNLDKAKNGTNDTLFHILELNNHIPLGEAPGSLGCAGDLSSPMPLKELAEMAKERLKSSYVHFVGEAGRVISRVAVCGGAGAHPVFFKQAAKMGCQAFITGDVTYHNAQAALDMGICLIDATHDATENIVTQTVAKYLRECFPGLEVIVSEKSTQVIHAL